MPTKNLYSWGITWIASGEEIVKCVQAAWVNGVKAYLILSIKLDIQRWKEMCDAWSKWWERFWITHESPETKINPNKTRKSQIVFDQTLGKKHFFSNIYIALNHASRICSF